MPICKRFFISGRVQGVFYRDSTRRRAREIGVTGWVRNLPDGRVEALVCGDETQVNTLADWFWQGSTASKVDQVEAAEAAFEPHDSFVVRRD